MIIMIMVINIIFVITRGDSYKITSHISKDREEHVLLIFCRV